MFQLTNNRRSDFCQPSPDSSPYTADDPVTVEAVGLPNAVIILISALAFVVVAILTSLGIYGLRKWKRPSVVTAPPAVEGWFNSDLIIRNHAGIQLASFLSRPTIFSRCRIAALSPFSAPQRTASALQRGSRPRYTTMTSLIRL